MKTRRRKRAWSRTPRTERGRGGIVAPLRVATRKVKSRGATGPRRGPKLRDVACHRGDPGRVGGTVQRWRRPPPALF